MSYILATGFYVNKTILSFYLIQKFKFIKKRLELVSKNKILENVSSSLCSRAHTHGAITSSSSSSVCTQALKIEEELDLLSCATHTVLIRIISINTDFNLIFGCLSSSFYSFLPSSVVHRLFRSFCF